jgi:hypothetical protein
MTDRASTLARVASRMKLITDAKRSASAAPCHYPPRTIIVLDLFDLFDLTASYRLGLVQIG